MSEPNVPAATRAAPGSQGSREAGPVAQAHAATGRWDRVVTVLIALAIALSSFLLFGLELIVGRLVLPVFGGAPAAWATVLAFFQGVLLLGYLYGHLSVSRLGPGRGAMVHVALVAVAVIALSLSPARLDALRDATVDPIVDLLKMLTLVVGLPAFLLTTTTPLLSSWYARLRGEGADPYWLYAASNGASFAALLLYPLVIQAALGLTAQRETWSFGFVVLGGILTAAAVIAALATTRLRRSARGSDLRPAAVVGVAQEIEPMGSTVPLDADVTDAAVRGLTAGRRVRWLLLAAVPSGLLAAITNLIATDLVSAPLLWAGPLAVYLLTFVVVFSPRLRAVIPAAVALAPVGVTLLWIPLGSGGLWPVAPLVLVEYLGFAVVATALHGRLAGDRPDPRHLTEFYLMLSIGGVIGGAFVGILAPLTFPGIWEFPILLVAGLVALAWSVPASATATSESATRGPAIRGGPARHRLQFGPFVSGAHLRLVPYGLCAGLLLLAIAPTGGLGLDGAARWLAVGGCLLLVGGQPRFFALATGLLLVLATIVLPAPARFQERSFFGVTRVLLAADGRSVELIHGNTIHGLQATDPALRREPTTYYARTGPAGDVFAVSRERTARAGSPAVVGIVGLGAGELAAYAERGDRFTFYEIDPVVVRVATNPTLFTFLSDMPASASIVLGDARLSLHDTAEGTLDLLVMDAFSSDSPPAHLLTTEAIDEAMRTVAPGGLLAVHVSNRFYDLAPAIAGAADALGLASLQRSYEPSKADSERLLAGPSIWVVVARAPGDLAGFLARGWAPVSPVPPLTDDNADMLRLLRFWR
jgi:hypothetical protein